MGAATFASSRKILLHRPCEPRRKKDSSLVISPETSHSLEIAHKAAEPLNEGYLCTGLSISGAADLMETERFSAQPVIDVL
ncbi:hypothetical protein TNCV_1778641 [Trichonephila clavipes]|nr:hypothetical protein TNCV_1778641 [Trichonephila clavipes]